MRFRCAVDGPRSKGWTQIIPGLRPEAVKWPISEKKGDAKLNSAAVSTPHKKNRIRGKPSSEGQSKVGRLQAAARRFQCQCQVCAGWGDQDKESRAVQNKSASARNQGNPNAYGIGLGQRVARFGGPPHRRVGTSTNMSSTTHHVKRSWRPAKRSPRKWPNCRPTAKQFRTELRRSKNANTLTSNCTDLVLLTVWTTCFRFCFERSWERCSAIFPPRSVLRRLRTSRQCLPTAIDAVQIVDSEA